MDPETVLQTSAASRADLRDGGGFRLSVTDAGVLLACGLGTWWLWGPLGEFALLLPFVLGHFFLFCNVFRVGTRAELVWCFCFVAVFLGSLHGGWFGMGVLLLAQSPVTLGVILYALTRPDYHGIFWKRLAGLRKPTPTMGKVGRRRPDGADKPDPPSP